MGRPGLTRHRKFARLERLLGSRPLARGCLELVWEVAYENGDDLLGEAEDVEHMAGWEGKPGKLVASLVDAGFIDQEGQNYRVHDLFDHAPDYVRKRLKREEQRKAVGAELRTLAGQRPVTDRSVSSTPAPAPAPAPAQATESCAEVNSAPALPDESPVVAVMPCVGSGPREFRVTEAMCAEWMISYPGVDVHREIARAVQWAKDNQPRRKTHRGARPFLSRWLAKAQDSGRNGTVVPIQPRRHELT